MRNAFSGESSETLPVKRGKLVDVVCNALDTLGISRNVMRWSDILINGRVIPRKEWLATTVADVDCIKVVYGVRGGGGGEKNPMRLILQAVVVIVAAILTFYAGGYGGWAAAGYYAAAAVVSIGGMMLINALFPLDAGQLKGFGSGDSILTYAIESTRNKASLYEAQELVIGRIRTAPSYACAYYSTFEGDEQYWHGLYQVSAGTVRVDPENVRIGSSPFSQYVGAEISIHEGWAGEPLRWFDSRRQETSENVPLRYGAAWTHRETPQGVKKIILIISFPQGLFWSKKNGGYDWGDLVLLYRWRLKGSDTWTTQSYRWQETRTRAFTRTVIIDLPDTGDDNAIHEYGLLREDAREDQERYSGVAVFAGAQYWFDEKSIKYRDGFTKTLIEIRLRASDQLQNAVNELNCIAESYGWVPDGEGNWNLELTSNPVALALHVMTNREISKRPYPKERIDWATAEEFYNFAVKYGWEYAAVRTDGARRAVVIADILASALGGLIAPSSPDGKYTFGWDDLDASYVDSATPMTCWGFELTKVFPITKIHGFRVEFPNREKDWQLDERIVYADGYDENNAENVVVWSPSEGNRGTSGIDHPDLIYKASRIRLAAIVHRPESVSWSTDWRSLDYRKGQKIALTYNTYLVGSGGGNVVKHIMDEDGLCEGVTINQYVNMVAGKPYIARSTKKKGREVTVEQVWPLVTTPGAINDLYFEYPIDLADAPEFMVPVTVGESGRDTMIVTIKEVKRSENFTAKVTAVPSKGAEILSAIDGPIPPFDSLITDPTYYQKGKPNPPHLMGVRSNEDVMIWGTGGVLIPRIAISFRIFEKSGITVDRVVAIYRRADSDGEWISAGTVSPLDEELYFQDVEEGVTYEIMLCAISSLGVSSDWSYAKETVVGMSTPPPDIISAFLENEWIHIVYDEPIDFAGYEVLLAYSSLATPAQAIPFSEGLFRQAPVFVGNNLFGERVFFIYAVDLAGNRSINPAAIRVQYEGAYDGNAVQIFDQRAMDWSGAISGGYIDEITGCIVSDDNSYFWGNPSADFWRPDPEPFWRESQYADIEYTFSITVSEDAINYAHHVLQHSILGQLLSIEYDVSGGLTFWERNQDGTGLFWGEDDAPFWGVEHWTHLPDSFLLMTPTLTIRVRVAGGSEQAAICQLKSIIDYPDKTETLIEINLPAGWSEIPLTGEYISIKYADAIIMETPGLDPWQILKRISGGRLEMLPVLSDNVTPTAATANIFIRGY